jgi:hypothetical protein
METSRAARERGPVRSRTDAIAQNPEDSPGAHSAEARPKTKLSF